MRTMQYKNFIVKWESELSVKENGRAYLWGEMIGPI